MTRCMAPSNKILPLLEQLRAELIQVAEPSRAPGMQAYMKSALPYHGVSAAVMRKVCQQVFAGLHFESAAHFRAAVLALWHAAQFREERHAAIELTELRLARPFEDLTALPMYEEMIVSGAWWDYVDPLATHRLSALVKRAPQPMAAAMREWSRSDNLWKRRSAILCQLPLKADTDLALLQECIAPALTSREFFLRKAIGWALRQYARTSPQWVLDYVQAH